MVENPILARDDGYVLDSVVEGPKNLDCAETWSQWIMAKYKKMTSVPICNLAPRSVSLNLI